MSTLVLPLEGKYDFSDVSSLLFELSLQFHSVFNFLDLWTLFYELHPGLLAAGMPEKFSHYRMGLGRKFPNRKISVPDAALGFVLEKTENLDYGLVEALTLSEFVRRDALSPCERLREEPIVVGELLRGGNGKTLAEIAEDYCVAHDIEGLTLPINVILNARGLANKTPQQVDYSPAPAYAA